MRVKYIKYISLALTFLLALVSNVGVHGQEQYMGFQRSLNDRSWGWQVEELDSSSLRLGLRVQRFELRQGDCGEQVGWSDCANDRERSEMSQLRPYIPLDRTIWASWNLKLDSNWIDLTPVTVTLGQFHHRDSSTPAILFVQRNGQLLMRIESAKSLYVGRDHYALASLEELRGQWVDIVVQARFTGSSNGIIRVWVKGKLRAEVRGITTLGTTPVFFKYGIYRSYVSRVPERGVQIAWYDEVRLGTSREQVDARLSRLRPRD